MRIRALTAACLLALGLAVPALAQDACLTGATTLTDQRALRSLTAAIEASCPCGAFSGGPGLDNRAFKRCANGVRDNALFAGDLRPECRARATADLKGTTCGGTKVACARYTPGSAKKPVACRLEALDRCEDTPRRDETACVDTTYCSDVVEWTAATCVDPRLRGPYAVGVQTIALVKNSAVTPGNPRTLNTLVWYPAQPGQGAENPVLAGVVDAALEGGGAPYPLLLFSHGSCGYAGQSTFLTALLASYGYIVAAPPHPGNTVVDAGCGTLQAQANSFIERPQDMVYVLNQMLARNADPGSPFFSTIDENAIGMSGHSFGGLTTYLTTTIEPRFKVAVPMAPAVLGTPSFDIPSLTLLGEIDARVNNDLARGVYASSVSPKMLVEIQEAGHYAFSDLCFPSPDCNPPVTLTQDEAHDLALRWLLPFLEVYLRGNPAFEPFFTLPPPPGVTFEAER